MKIINILSVIIVLIIFLLLNYYIGYKGKRLLKALHIRVNRIAYWIVFWIVAMSFMAAEIFRDYIPSSAKEALDFVGSFWLSFMLYIMMFLLLFEIVNLVGRRAHIWERHSISRETITRYAGIIIVAATMVILTIGFLNAHIPEVRTYQLEMAKKSSKLDNLNIVMVSDIHVGSPGHKSLVDKTVKEINALNPDIVLITGDIIDSKVEPFIKGNYSEKLAGIKSKYGVYAVTGNHEYYGGDSEKLIQAARAAGINILLDQNEKIADSFYLVGRVDKTAGAYTGRERKDINELMAGVDKSYPVILMDHQPMNLDSSANAGVDLQFSGHTHKGQIFPSNIFTKYIYEIDWGYLKKGNYQIVVSSGLGTWGPPIRLGSRSEIVNAKITFK